MKVYITCHPDSCLENLIQEKILSVLNSVPGEISFFYLKPISKKSLERFERNFNLDVYKPLPFEYFNNLIEEFRIQSENIEDHDFIVLLTHQNNNRNFASSFKNKNIFIRSTHWENYIRNGRLELIFTQQIVENIFDSLIKVNPDNIKDDPNIHLFPTGCLNDLCSNKYHFILKIRTAHICDDCIDCYLETDNSANILIHLQHILTKVRDEFSNYDRIKNRINDYTVKVSDEGTVKIGEKEINLKSLPKAIYILAIKHPEGIPYGSFDSDKNKRNLFKIYERLEPSVEMDSLNTICESASTKENYFRNILSNINTEIKNKLGYDVAIQYTINGRSNLFRIEAIINQEFIKL